MEALGGGGAQRLTASGSREERHWWGQQKTWPWYVCTVKPITHAHTHTWSTAEVKHCHTGEISVRVFPLPLFLHTGAAGVSLDHQGAALGGCFPFFGTAFFK